MRILRRYDIRVDFFEINPQTESVKEFVKIRDGKIILQTNALQSQIMWAIALVYDYDSLYYNLQEDERKLLIAKDYLKEPDFFEINEKPLRPVIKKYMFLQRDSERRYLNEWNNKVDEISVAIKKWKATDKNLDKIMVAMKKQKELLEQKDEIMDRIAKRMSSDEIRGGGELSLIESGRI